MNDDFYIGWEQKAPFRHRRATRCIVVGLLIFAMLAGFGFASAQRLIGTAFFDWGNVKEFTGLLRIEPYPHLVISADGRNGAHVAAPLVAPFKFGLKCDAICGFAGQHVSLRATRICRDGQLMLEVEPNSVAATENTSASLPSSATNTVSIGRQTFLGEIVDSKCWMGVMNPSVLTTHRACAVRCISGGIPPMLLVRRENAPPLNFLLTDALGKPVNDRVLDYVAEPLEITGEVQRQGELLILRADPAKYQRVTR